MALMQPAIPKRITPEVLTLQALAANDLLEHAFAWLCQQRKDWPANGGMFGIRVENGHKP
jgi:hypothetical protein